MKTITMMRVMRRVRERARSMLLMSLRRSIMRPWKRPPPLLSSEKKNKQFSNKTSTRKESTAQKLHFHNIWCGKVVLSGEKHFLKGLKDIFTDESFYFRDKSFLLSISTSLRINVFLMNFYPTLNRESFFSINVAWSTAETEKAVIYQPFSGA
jgi:hypothetical protein